MALCSCMILSIKVLGKGRRCWESFAELEMQKSSLCKTGECSKANRSKSLTLISYCTVCLERFRQNTELHFYFISWILAPRNWSNLTISFPIFPGGFGGVMSRSSEVLPFPWSMFFCMMSVISFGSCYFSAHLWYIFLWDCHAFTSPLPPCSSQEICLISKRVLQISVKLMISYRCLWN